MNHIDGKTILFTGATSGLGKVAAIELASKGASIIAFARDRVKAQILIDEFNRKHPNAQGTIKIVECDLSSLKSIKNACLQVVERFIKIDAIVNNAGTWNFEFNETVDGIENTLQVNLLAPIVIINLTIDLLKNADEPVVINTASALHQGTINFNNIEFRQNFSGFKAYRQSKLGVILITRLYSSKFSSSGIHFYSQHPGLVDTNLVRKGGRMSKLFFKVFGKTPQSGAKNLLHILQTPEINLKDGEYYKNCRVSKTATKASYDMQLAHKLHEVCMQFLKETLK